MFMLLYRELKQRRMNYLTGEIAHAIRISLMITQQKIYRTCFKNWIWADAKALAIQRSQVI
jgi:hypothetical protein